MKKQGLVNIYHFVRKSTYNDGVFTQEDFDTLKNEMDILKQHQLPATYALKHDAVVDEQYTTLIKSMIDSRDEVGAWWEITQEMADKAGVVWKGCDVIDLHVKAGYSLAYLPEERKKLLDVYMADFKEVYGYYPKTIGSWVMDIVSFEYAKEKYGVIGGGLCRDQKGIDGFTLWGGYVNGAYYPSKVNEYMPAQSHEMQIDMPIFKLLGPDPIYNFEGEVRVGAEGIYTLEPAWTCGQSEEWVNWLLRCITEEEQVGYGYTQAGQENSFIWGNVGEGFEMQMRQIAALRKENRIRVETLRDSSEWFLKKYCLTPPITYTASTDWNKKFDLRTTWYSSRFYRTSLLWDKGELSIRDLYIFDENYESRYLADFIDNNESVFDALPILDACSWSTKEKRAAIDFINLDTNKGLIGAEPTYHAGEDDHKWTTQYVLENGQMIEIECTEEAMHIASIPGGREYIKWGLKMNCLPVLESFSKQVLVCKHEGHSYRLRLEQGSFSQKGEDLILEPEIGELKLVMHQMAQGDGLEFFTDTYKSNAKAFDEAVEMPVVIDEDKMKEIKLIKPIVSHRAKVKGYDEMIGCSMVNPNEMGTIHYTLDGTDPTEQDAIYKEELIIKEACIVKARTFALNRRSSDEAVAKYYNTLPIASITSPTQFDTRQIFNRKGALDLIDGHKGSMNYVDNCWLITQDLLDVTLDLGELRTVEVINIGFMQSKRSGPCYPEYVTFKISQDGINFREVDTQYTYETSGDPDIEIKDVITKVNEEVRYVQIIAKPYKNYFIFTDEVVIEGK